MPWAKTAAALMIAAFAAASLSPATAADRPDTGKRIAGNLPGSDAAPSSTDHSPGANAG